MKNNSGKIWFLGRGYEEYLEMFRLDLKKLKSMRILDCAAGASSFTSRMTKMGYDVTAGDIMYDTKPEQIENVSEDDFKTLMEFHNGLEDKVDWDFFKTPEELTNYRIETYKEFAEDYKKGKGVRYIKAELPILPFPDNSFDLVLCSHLLFLYEDRLSCQFHMESIKEMLRVARHELIIYPLVKLRGHGQHSQYLEPLMEYFSSKNDLEIQKIDYHFRKGADEIMKIKI